MKYADMAITVSDLNKYMKEKIAEDEYLNTYYSINAMMEEKEFEKILENMMIKNA